MDLQKHGSDVTHVLDSDITHILDSKSTTKEDDWTRRGKPFVSEIKDHCFFFFLLHLSCTHLSCLYRANILKFVILYGYG